jgi:hypothetical protein
MVDIAQLDAVVRTIFRSQFRAVTQFRASSVALIAANLLPLFGVIFLDWDAFSIVALYWVENVIIGLIDALKLIVAKGPSGGIAAALFLLHYGFFCFIHGIFVLALFGHDDRLFSPADELTEFARLFTEQHLWWAIAALAASHLFSFVTNYLGRREYERQNMMEFVVQAYGRIFVLHIAIILGGWIAMAMGSSVGVLFLLIVGKTMMDLKFHLHLHEEMAAKLDSAKSV